MSGAHRYVRIRVPAGTAAAQTVSSLEVKARTLRTRGDISVDLSAGTAEAGVSVRAGSWSVAGGNLVSDAAAEAVGVVDLCGDCELGREVVRQATVKMLVEFPASNPSSPGVGAFFGVGFEESEGRRRGAEFQLAPWRPLGGGRGPLSFAVSCGGGGALNKTPHRLRADTVSLDCAGKAAQGFVAPTVQGLGDEVDGDLALAGRRVWVELEYRNLKLWARVWPENGARPALARGGMRFGPRHFSSDSFGRDESWILNPGKLVLSAQGFSSGDPLKVSDVTVTELLAGPELGAVRGAASESSDGQFHRGRFFPMGKRVDDRPGYAELVADGELPSVVISDSSLAGLYDYAWESALERVWVPGQSSSHEALYRSFLDESYNESAFLWDLASMMWFGKYMNGVSGFDPLGTLEIWYQTQRDSGAISRVIHPDGTVVGWATSDGEVNPPLLVWSEWQWYLMTGDEDRVRRVLPALREFVDWVSIARWAQAGEHRLFWNDGGGSGMDTIVRPHGRWGDGGSVYADPDTSGQVAQAYLLLGALYDAAGDGGEAGEMRAVGEEIAARIDHFLWGSFQEGGKELGQWFYADKDGDIVADRPSYDDAPQATGLWPALAGLPAGRRQAVRNIIASPAQYNTDVPFPAVAKSHRDYRSWGFYNGVLHPVSYMGVKAAEEVGGHESRPEPRCQARRRHGRGFRVLRDHLGNVRAGAADPLVSAEPPPQAHGELPEVRARGGVHLYGQLLQRLETGLRAGRQKRRAYCPGVHLEGAGQSGEAGLHRMGGAAADSAHHRAHLGRPRRRPSPDRHVAHHPRRPPRDPEPVARGTGQSRSDRSRAQQRVGPGVDHRVDNGPYRGRRRVHPSRRPARRMHPRRGHPDLPPPAPPTPCNRAHRQRTRRSHRCQPRPTSPRRRQ